MVIRVTKFNLVMTVSLIIYTILTFCSYVVGNLNIQLVIVLVTFTTLTLASLIKRKQNIVFLFFMVTFFTFVLGKYAVGFITGENIWETYDIPIYKHTLLCIQLSLVGLFVSFLVFNNKKTKINFQDYQCDNNQIFLIVRLCFIATSIFQFLIVGERVLAVQNNSYIVLHNGEFQSVFPYFITKLAQMNTLFFCICLALLPKKKQIIGCIVLYLSVVSLNLFSGSRGNMMIGFCLVLSYVLFRTYACSEQLQDSWLKKKHFIFIFIGAVSLMVIMNFAAQWRYHTSGNFNGMINEILYFFEVNGGSVSVIELSKIYEVQLDALNQSYVHGWFFDTIFKLNPTSTLIDEALYGNNLGAALTYISNPNYYLSGGGLGTQYIAEVYMDYGYVGIFIFNILVGFIICKMNFVVSKNSIINSLLVISTVYVFTYSRNMAAVLFTSFFGATNWAILLIILLIKPIRFITNRRIRFEKNTMVSKHNYT